MTVNFQRFSASALVAYERGKDLYPSLVEEIAELAERKMLARLERGDQRWAEVTSADWNAAAAEVAERHGATR